MKWAQEFYMIDNFITQLDEFTPPNSPELLQIPHNKYYGSTYLILDDLEIPDILSRMLDLIAGLSVHDRRRFIRAAQWVYVANAVWVHHASSSYIALVAVNFLRDGYGVRRVRDGKG